MSKIQEINVYIVPKFNNKVLVLKRKNGIWEFPGGGIEWGETPEQSAEREFKEETSLVPKNLQFLTITSATYKKEEKDKHSIYIVYSAECEHEKVILCKEHIEYRWLTIPELKFLKLGLNAEPIIDLL